MQEWRGEGGWGEGWLRMSRTVDRRLARERTRFADFSRTLGEAG